MLKRVLTWPITGLAADLGSANSIEECFHVTRLHIIKTCAPAFGVLGLMAVGYAHFTGAYTNWVTVSLCAFAALGLLLAPLLTAKGARPELIGSLIAVTLLAGLYSDAWYSGGISAPVIPVLCQILVLAAVFVGLRAAFAIAVLTSAALVVLTFFAPFGTSLSAAIPAYQGGVPEAVVQIRALTFALVSVWAVFFMVSSLFLLVHHIGGDILRKRDSHEAEASAINTFLATLSHDMRTPLNAIIGMSSLLKDIETPPEPEEMHDHAKLINDSGKCMLDMLDDMLLYAKMDSKEATLDLADVDLFELANTQVMMLQVKAAEKNQELSFEESSPNGLHITCDASKVGRVIGNLISNALKYSPSGAKVDIALGETTEGAYFVIHDNGEGMTSQEVAEAQRPFAQLANPNGARSVDSGVGLGLNICQSIVKLHGGTFTIESAKGLGTSVSVTLPRKVVGTMAA